MTTPLYVGMGPPYFVRVTIPASDDFDPAAVTLAVLEVTKPGSHEAVTWEATHAPSEDELTVSHALEVDDLDEVGIWKLWVRCTVSGGERRTVVGKFKVLSVAQATG